VNAVEALREFGVRWANVNLLPPAALVSGDRLSGKMARARDQLCFVLSGLTHAPDDMIGEALGLSRISVLKCRHRFWERHRTYPAIEALTTLMLRAVGRDGQFLETFLQVVSQAMAAREAAASRSRSDALFHTSQRPDFEIRRRTALQTYFDEGGRQALADRSLGNDWARKEAANV
jgi:hypothetical protein